MLTAVVGSLTMDPQTAALEQSRDISLCPELFRLFDRYHHAHLPIGEQSTRTGFLQMSQT